MKKQPPIILVILILFLFSCNDNEIYTLPENAEHLIYGESSKSWKIARRYNDDIRMNMGPCFMEYRQTFEQDKTVSDNNEKNKGCGASLHGTWYFVKGPQDQAYIKITSPDMPELLNTEKPETIFQ